MRTLYGSYSDDCCGFCTLHHVGVTPKQLGQKRCTEQRCIHFRRYKDHWYWPIHKEKKAKLAQEKAERKARRKLRKKAQNEYYERLMQKKAAREADPIAVAETESFQEPELALVFATGFASDCNQGFH